MTKVQIQVKCEHCRGQAYLPHGQAVDHNGEPYTRYRRCYRCLGSGTATRWIGLSELAALLHTVDDVHLKEQS